MTYWRSCRKGIYHYDFYHGSNTVVTHPDIIHCRTGGDLGQGFYTTLYYNQAKQWCQRFKHENQEAYISSYLLDETSLDTFKIHRFDTYNQQWLDFIVSCRSMQDKTSYDIVISGVANDKIFNTLELYFNQLIDKKEVVQRLQYINPDIHICLRTQYAIDTCLIFKGSEKL